MLGSDSGIGVHSGINPFLLESGIFCYRIGIRIGIRNLKNAGIGFGTGMKTIQKLNQAQSPQKVPIHELPQQRFED